MSKIENPFDGLDDRLMNFSIREIDGLLDAVTLARDVLLGVVNQPRFDKPEADSGRNRAGEEIELLIDALNGCTGAMYLAAQSISPRSSSEVKYRAWVLLKYSANCADGLKEHAIESAGLAAQFDAAERLEAGQC